MKPAQSQPQRGVGMHWGGGVMVMVGTVTLTHAGSDTQRGGWLGSWGRAGSGTGMLGEHPRGPIQPQLLLILGVSGAEHLSPLLGMRVELRTSSLGLS